MPYNTRRKSLSLPSLGIHIPVTHTTRAKSGSRPSLSSGGSSPLSDVPSDMESHPSKRLKRAHPGKVPEEALEQTPPPSPTVAASIEMTDAPKIDFVSINDDIVEAVVTQLQTTANRPHLVKELATVLGQSLTSVQQSANPCAIISSRLASYMKRPCWSALSQCPLAKELETVHPRRTYFFLTTLPRQPIPDSSAPAIVAPIIQPALVTPSASLTDDSASDDVEGRRRELSPSPEVDLSSPEEFDENEDIVMPGTPVVAIPSQRNNRARSARRHDSPPLEKDEREFTQTADVLLKRKLSQERPVADAQERVIQAEYGFRDEIWFASDSRLASSVAMFNSPAMKPSTGPIIRKDDDGDSWTKFSKLAEWDMGAESIEIEELDFLFDSY